MQNHDRNRCILKDVIPSCPMKNGQKYFSLPINLRLALTGEREGGYLFMVSLPTTHNLITEIKAGVVTGRLVNCKYVVLSQRQFGSDNLASNNTWITKTKWYFDNQGTSIPELKTHL